MRMGIAVLSILLLASSAAAVVVNETQKLYASDAAAADTFGESVAASENYLVVGAPGNDVIFGTLVADMGAAYVFVRNVADEWIQQARLTPIDGGTPVSGPAAGFGGSVAISGQMVLVGAPGERAVYVYHEDGAGGWPHFQKIVSPSSDLFGAALAVSGDRLIVGAQDAVYFFEYDLVVGWKPAGSFTPVLVGSGFGYSVAIDGVYAVVGALNDDHLGVNVGAAHAYAWTGTKWVYEGTLPLPAGLGPGYEFGHSVAVSGTTILVSASRFLLGGGPGGVGKAYLYDRISGVWQPRSELEALDPSPSGEFGWSVALQNAAALATDPYYNGTALNTGRAYVFTPSGAITWQKSFTLEASDGELADYFGSWIAESGGTVLVGAWGDDDLGSTAGAAYVFELALGPGGGAVPATSGLGVLLFAGATLILGVLYLRRSPSRLL